MLESKYASRFGIAEKFMQVVRFEDRMCRNRKDTSLTLYGVTGKMGKIKVVWRDYVCSLRSLNS